MVLFVYSNTLGNYYVLDDEPIIFDNPNFQNISNIPKLFTEDFCEGIQLQCSYYRPFIAISHLLDIFIWEEKVWGYHLTNVTIHLAVVLILYFGVIRVFGNHRAALLASLLFAIHPIHTESVAWLTSRTDPIASIFILLSFGFFHGYLKTKTQTTGSKDSLSHLKSLHLKWWGYGCYWVSLFLFFLALLAKEMAITLPLLLFTYEVLFGFQNSRTTHGLKEGEDRLPQNLFLAGQKTQEKISKKNVWNSPLFGRSFWMNLRGFQHYLPFLGIILIYFGVRQAVLGSLVLGGEIEEKMAGGWPLIPVIVWEYFRLLVFPYPLVVLRPSPLIEGFWSGRVLGSLLFVIGFALILYKVRRDFKGVVFGGFWFLISLLPLLFLVPFSTLEPNERYAYIPSIGFVLMMGFIGDWIYSNSRSTGKNWVRVGVVGIFAGVLLGLGGFTLIRNQDFKDEVILWKGHNASFPDSPYAHIGYKNLGTLHHKRGEIEVALTYYQKFLKTEPDSPDIYYKMGVAYQQLKAFEKALEAYQKALTFYQGDYLIFYNMGLIYKDTNRMEMAENLLKLSINVEPAYYWSHRAMGNVLEYKGDWKRAIEHFEAALVLQPNDSHSHQKLSHLYLKLDQPSPTRPHFERFLNSERNDMIKRGRENDLLEEN